MRRLFAFVLIGLLPFAALAEDVASKVERTLSIIKPDGVSKNLIGKIDQKFEEKGLKIVAMKLIKLTPEQAGRFYEVHQDKPFYNDLKDYMASGPVVVQVLEGNNAIKLNREIMGATDPAQAAKGTIRAEFAESKSRNAVHGSDAPETAASEIRFFFSDLEIQ